MFWNPKMLHLGGALLVLSTTCCAMLGENGEPAKPRLGHGNIGRETFTIETEPDSETFTIETETNSTGEETETFTRETATDSTVEEPQLELANPDLQWSRSSPRNPSELAQGEEKNTSGEEGSEEESKSPTHAITIHGAASGDKDSKEEPASKRSCWDKYYWPVLLGILTVATWYSPSWKMITNDGVEDHRGDGFLNTPERLGHTAQGLFAALLLPEYNWPMQLWWGSCLGWLQPLGMVILHLVYPTYNFVKRYGKMSDGHYCAQGCICDDIEDDDQREKCEAFETMLPVTKYKDACEGIQGVWTGAPIPEEDCPKVWYDSSYYSNLMDFNIGYLAGGFMILIALVAGYFLSKSLFSKNDDNPRRKYCHRALLALAAVVIFVINGYAIYLGVETQGNLAAPGTGRLR